MTKIIDTLFYFCQSKTVILQTVFAIVYQSNTEGTNFRIMFISFTFGWNIGLFKEIRQVIIQIKREHQQAYSL